MSASLYDLQKFAATGQASSEMTHYDKMRALSMAGGKIETLTGVPPMSFRANGKPLISLSMLGNGRQQGTPTPDAPIMPEFVGVKTVNICPSGAAETKTSNGITAVSNGSGTYHVSGTATADADIRFDVKSFLIPKSIGSHGSGTYSMFNSTTYANADVKIAFYYHGTKIDDWGLTVRNRTNTTYSNMGEKDCDAIGFTVKSGVTVDFTISPEFTDDGILPSEFEPFGYKIPITCGGTTTPVYLGQTQTVRQIRKKVLDGSESWFVNEAVSTEDTVYLYTMAIAQNTYIQEYSICSHFEYKNAFTIRDDNGFHLLSGYGGLRFRIMRTIAGTVADFKAYLAQQYAAGTPVTVWYVLAEPQTGIVNEPLAKIGDYADELHITDEVTIPTVKGQNTLTVDTDLQPSEMTITYTR